MVPAVALAYAWPLVKQLFDCRSYRAPIRRGMHCNHDFERWRGTTTGGNETPSAFRALTGARTLKWKVFSQAIPEGPISRYVRLSGPLYPSFAWYVSTCICILCSLHL